MGTCIICHTDVDGHICPSHEEDVCFDFTGTEPDQLTPSRFYQGTVDGYADFGVFVDIGDRVTGLLHRSELPRRLESLDWNPGETVFVQVMAVRDNGNVDLGWSIRQAPDEFRGHLIHTPEGDELPGEAESTASPSAVERASSDAPSDRSRGDEPPSTRSEPPTHSAEDSTPDRTAAVSNAQPRSTTHDGGTGTASAAAMESPLARSEVAGLADEAGSPVRLEGEIVEVRQTGGPTIFELRDETGTVDCAAFEAPGVRAYPDIEPGDLVRADGLVEDHRGEVQIEVESMLALEGDERAVLADRLETALDERAEPTGFEPLTGHPPVTAVTDGLIDAARAVRRAVFEARPVVIRHRSNADGYVAAAAIERAVLQLVRDEHEEQDAEYHYVDRRPLEDRVYDLADAMRDTTQMLDARERHGEKVPLFVFVGAASTKESVDALNLLGVYDAKRVVVDGGHPDDEAAGVAETFVNPHRVSREGDLDVTSTALAANIAIAVDPEVRDAVRHLPAVSYWQKPPEAYIELASDAGYDERATTQLREAIALEAFYHVYEDKRELVADLLFGDSSLIEPASDQFRRRLETAVRTAEPHLEEWRVDGTTLGVLDVDAYTHRYDFPPPEVLLSTLAARAGDLTAVIGLGVDELTIWSREPVDRRAVAEAVAEAAPGAGVEVRGGRDGSLVFLSGERDAVLEAAIAAVADRV